MAKKGLNGLFGRQYQVGIGEAISANRSDQGNKGFGYFKSSKKISVSAE